MEDYGVGFYTKYGDGGVDIAPIADLYKTEVWELGEYLEIDERICQAPPTDGKGIGVILKLSNGKKHWFFENEIDILDKNGNSESIEKKFIYHC